MSLFFMSLRVGLLSIALSYILLGTSYSQHEKSNYIHFSNEEGLSNPNISTIEQDREGFIWIGTHNGINVFDGYDFRVYTQTPADSTSLVHNFIYSIYKDKKEDLWIGTGGGGIMKYNYLEDNFIRYTNSPLDSNTLLNDYVTCIRGNDQFLWVATWGGLSSFQFKSGSFKNYKFEKELKNSGIINSIALDKDWLWIGTSEDGIIKFNPSTGEKIRYKENDLLGKNYASNKTKDIYVDKGGKVWVSTHEGGIQFFNNNKKSFENARGIEEKLGAIMVNTINEDKNGNLVLGTSKGMYSYNPINYDVNPVHEQVNQDISEIFFDNQGGTWYGVKDGGINYVSSKNQPFENYSFKADPGNLKGNSIVTSVFILGKDSLLVGYESGLCLYYKVNQGFKKNSIPIPLPVNKTSNEITCIFECRQGYLWLGYNGLLRYDFKTGKSKLYQHDDNSVNSISSNIIRDIIEDKRGHLWIATENGLCEFDKKKEKFIVYSKENFPGMVDPVIFSLTIDQLDALWFGTRNMVIKYKYKNGLATIYDKETYGIHGDNFFFIKGFEQGKMWFSSEKGLHLLDEKLDKVIAFYNSKDGLPGNLVRGMEKDNEQNLWITTNNGLSRFNTKDNTFMNFYKEDGLLDIIFNKNSIFKYENQMIIVGNNGITSFFPGDFKIKKIEPRIAFTDFILYDNSKPTSNLSLLRKCLHKSMPLQLDYNDKIFSFEFTALDYIHPGKVQYSYMLENFDQDWHLTDDRKRSAIYMNIPPGEYIFKVKANNSNGTCTSTPREIIIKISPPYWNTWWFKLTMILLFFIILFVIYRTKMKNYKVQKVDLQQQVIQREKEIGNKNEELAQQAENLQEINSLLKEKQEKVIKQNQQILKQKKELEKHQHHLEELVEKRTRALDNALKKIKESDQLKTAFLENISHELRTPMNGILGFTELLAKNNLEEKEKIEYLGVIQNSTNQLLTIVNDIVELSKLESKQVVLNEEESDLNHLMEELLGLVMSEKQNRVKDFLSVTLKKGIKTNNKIYVDIKRLRQIFTYLLVNAIKFTEKGGVEFGYNLKDADILFYVRDSGIGIRPEKQKIIFERFRQVDDSHSRKYGGTGLGLAISRGLVELFGGKIWLDSQPALGSTFYFTIPYKPVNQDNYYHQVITKNPEQVDWKNRVILIVEDEEYNFNYLRETLGHSNAIILQAMNGKQALQLCKDERKIDLVLMDIKLPDFNGLDITRQIRKTRKELPIIAQTSYTHSKDKEKFIAAGCSDFISKPIDSNMLIKKINVYFKKDT